VVFLYVGKFLLNILLILGAFFAMGKNDLLAQAEAKEKYFRYDYSNDFFTGTDFYFTQGIEFEYGNPGLESSPIMRPLISFKEADRSLYSLGIHYIGYTPKDPYERAVQIGDRPFFNSFYIDHKLASIKLDSHLKYINSIELGLFGPITGGDWVHKGIHKLTGNRRPLGWPNQIENDIIINYSFDLEKFKYFFSEIIEASASFRGQIGSNKTRVGSGVNLKIGRIHTLKDQVEWGANPKNTPFYAYFRPEVWYAIYDASLQGGIFSRDSIYTIKTNEIERIVTKMILGIAFSIGNFQIQYDQAWISKEFKTGDSHAWGHLGITRRF